MSFVFEIGITQKNNQEIEKKETVEVIASKGIVSDRYFHEFNSDREQITLIESENIDYYNKTFNTNFNYLQFRRNIVTKGIELNPLVGKNIFVGKIKLKVSNRALKSVDYKGGIDNFLKIAKTINLSNRVKNLKKQIILKS